MSASPNESESPTVDLCLRARAGDRAALGELFAGAGDRLLLFIQLRLGPGLRAQVEPLDLLQETWLAALQGFERFDPRGPGSFNAWLCRIAENRIADLGRRGARAKRTAPGQLQPISVILDEARASATGPFSAAARAESYRELEEAVAQLEGPDREALLMRHFEERTLDEIAERTGASPTAVRRRLGRVLGLLGTRLAVP